MAEVVTCGETMVGFCPEQPGPLRHADRFLRLVGGAESNVAIGLCRLGHSAQWVGRVGDDPFGELVVATLRGEGVDVSAVRRDPEAPTGVFFKERRAGAETAVTYYRHGSAGSRLAPADLPAAAVAGCRVVHLTGITPALSASCRETVRAAIALARATGAVVAFDPNYRARLWSPAAARETLLPLLPAVDILLLTRAEGHLLFGSEDPDTIAREARARGARHVAVRCGAEGTWAYAAEGPGTLVPTLAVTPLEPVGAGDAFAAGYLAGFLEGRPETECVRLGNVCGALATTALGDWEGIPDRATAERLLGGAAAPAR